MSPSHVSLPLYGLQYFSVGHELVLLTLSCLLSFFHFFNVSSMGLSYAIHRNHMSTPHTHPWEPARPCPWEPRITPLFSTISNIPLLGFFFSPSPGSLCVGCLRLSLFLLGGTMNTSPHLPHTIMGSNTICQTVCLTDPSNNQLVKDEEVQIFYSIRSQTKPIGIGVNCEIPHNAAPTTRTYNLGSNTTSREINTLRSFLK